MGSMRIARALALTGIAARRKCEAVILEGLVTINGETVRDLGRQVEPDKDEIRFWDKPLISEQPVYFMLHKPAGDTTTASDPHAEKTVYDLLPENLKVKGSDPFEGAGVPGRAAGPGFHRAAALHQ